MTNCHTQIKNTDKMSYKHKWYINCNNIDKV